VSRYLTIIAIAGVAVIGVVQPALSSTDSEKQGRY
jgi:hypothetical protein